MLMMVMPVMDNIFVKLQLFLTENSVTRVVKLFF